MTPRAEMSEKISNIQFINSSLGETLMFHINRSIRTLLGTLSILAAPAFATAPNTTVAGIVSYEVNQGWVTHYFDEMATTRWFSFGEVGGHSYCIEAVQGPVSAVQLDPNLAVFTDTTGATALTVSGTALTNDNGGGDPNFIKGARICYIAQATVGTTSVRGLKINTPITAGSGDAGYLRLRVVDTTLFASLVPTSTSSDRAILTNYTGATVSISTWCPNGGTSAKQTGTLSANVATVIAMPIIAFNAPVACFIAHNAPLGSIRGTAHATDQSSGGTMTYDITPRQ